MFSEGAAAFLVSPVLITSLFSVTGLFCAVSGLEFVFTSSLGFLLKSAAVPAPISPAPNPIPPALSQSFPCHVLWLLCSVKFLSSFLGLAGLAGSVGLAGSAGLAGSGFPKLSSTFGAVFPSRGT